MIRNVNKLLNKPKKGRNPIKKNQQFQIKQQESLQKNLNHNLETFRSIYRNCSDVIFHNFFLFGTTKAVIIFIEGLSDNELLDQNVISPLSQEIDNESQSNKDDGIYLNNPLSQEADNESQQISELIEKKITISKLNKVHLLADCIDSIATGNPLLLYEGGENGYSLGLTKFEMRSIQEPEAESTIRGPREGFTESLQVNISQIRRIIKSPALKVQTMKIGKYTQTSVAITYIEGLAEPTLIEEVENRLNGIQVDGILESELIEEMIEDNPYSPFPQIISSERPDVASSALLEGRVVIMTDGTPFILVVPVSFFSFLQTPDDYYQRFIVGSFTRMLRNVFLVISLLFPSLYVAVTTFHQEMIPASLLLSIAAAREAVPFPALIEVILMEVMFEALREAGIRLPKQIGSAVSIVGALVIGQAAVQAGLVSAPMIIVVSSTGIASFMSPRYIAGYPIRLLRFPIILLAGTLGLLGIMMGLLAIIIHLCALRSFGEPYMAPLAPLKKRELKDAVWRAPFWMMDTRPHFTGEESGNLYRQAPNQAPSPQKGGQADK